MASQEDRCFTRRELLAGALGVVGLAALGGIPADAAEGEPSAMGGKTPMKIGCGTVCFRQLPLEGALERISRAGYQYFETQAVGPWCPHVDPWKDDPQKFRQLAQKYGFKGVTGLWSPNGAIIPDPKSVEGVTQAIRWAREAGIPIVHAGDGHKPGDMSEADALKVLRDRLAAILEVAGQCQVRVAIEPHGTFSLTADGLKKIMGLSQSRWLGINYDMANVHRAFEEAGKSGNAQTPANQGQDEVATLKAVADRVVHVHAKDVAGGKCVALGAGTVNVRDCLRVLRARGYQDVVSLETEGDDSPEDAQKLIEASRGFLVNALA